MRLQIPMDSSRSPGILLLLGLRGFHPREVGRRHRSKQRQRVDSQPDSKEDHEKILNPSEPFFSLLGEFRLDGLTDEPGRPCVGGLLPSFRLVYSENDTTDKGDSPQFVPMAGDAILPRVKPHIPDHPR